MRIAPIWNAALLKHGGMINCRREWQNHSLPSYSDNHQLLQYQMSHVYRAMCWWMMTHYLICQDLKVLFSGLTAAKNIFIVRWKPSHTITYLGILKITPFPSDVSSCKNIHVKDGVALSCVIYSSPSMETPSMGDIWTFSPSRDGNLLSKTVRR